MAIEQIARVLRLPLSACSRRERHVLNHLADIARPDGTGIYCGERAIAKRAGVVPRVVRLAMSKLRRRGWLIVERPGGGRRADGKPKRTIWRLQIPTLKQLPNPGSVNTIERFPQAFPQSMHNPDRSIPVNPDRSIPVNPDRSIRSGAAQTSAAAAGCPVGRKPLRPEFLIRPEVSTDQKELPLSKHDDEERDRAARMALFEETRRRCLKASESTPRRRRRTAES